MKAVLTAVVLLAMLSAWAQRSAPSATSLEDEQAPTVTVDVRLVNVFVTVTDPNGAPVASLEKENFELFEDGHRQKIAIFDRESELPLSIVLAVDTSLSTRKDLKLEVESARRFARSILRPVDAMALFQFNEVVDELVPFTSDLRRVDRGLNRVHLGSATAMYDALYLGAGSLEKRQGRKVMVVITDGGDTVSHVDYPTALRAAQQSEAIVYSIIVVPIENDAGRDTGGEHALIQISRDTGGKHYYAKSINQLDQAFAQISKELRTQYLLAYYPARRLAESGFRRIEVRVQPAADGVMPDFRVRHRTGYYTYKSK